MKIKNRIIPAKPRSKELLNRYYHSGFSSSSGGSSNTSDGGLGSPSYWELIDTDAEGNPLTEPYILTKYSAVSERELTAHKVGTGGGDEPIVGGVTSLSNLTDVDLSSPLSGHMLVYNGTRWVNQEATGTGDTYVHPATHPASMIVEDSTRRFVTDVEKDFWNSLVGGSSGLELGETDTTAYRGDRGKLAYEHISDTVKHITSNERNNWNDKWKYNEATIKAVKVDKAFDSDTVNGFTVEINVPDNAKFTDTIIDISGKADKATTLAGYGITDAYTKTEVNSALVSKLDKSVFDDLFEKVEVSTGVFAIKAKYNFYDVGEVSAYGIGSGGGSGGGSMSMMQGWTSTTATENYYLPAKLAVPFYTDTGDRLTALEAGTAPASHKHPTTDITGLGNIATINKNNSTANYLRGDGTWATPPNKTYSTATTSANGLMSSADKSKLNGIASNANNYSLPTASDKVLGGVKVGSRLSIASGVLSATQQTANDFTTVLKNKLDGIASNANNYSLPTASDKVLGGIKVGSRLTITSGKLSANIQSDNNFTNSYKTKLDGAYNHSQAAHDYLPLAGGTLTGNVTAPKFIGALSGNADTATALTTTNVGGGTQPIYFNGGKPVASTSNVGGTTTPIYLKAGVITALDYTIAKSVPSDANFNNTTYSAGNGISLNSNTFSVAGGNGLVQETSGLRLGTPSNITLSSTNSVATDSHTHNFTLGGKASQYLNGATTLITIPTITAGNGLTGGGQLTSGRTLTLGKPSTLTASTTNEATATSHTHSITTTSVGAANTIVQTDASGGTKLGNLTIGSNWKLEQIGTELVFKYNNVIKARFLADGSIASTNELSAHQ